MVPSANSSSISRARQVGQQLAGLVQHARRVGQHHQLLGLQHLGELAGHHVGVDVVVLVVGAEAQRRDHRDELVVLQRLHHARVDRLDLADLAHVVFDARVLEVEHLQLARADQPAVAAGQAHRLAAGHVDQADDVLLHLAGEHPLDHFHGLVVGDAHALDEGALLADLGQRLVDLRAAAVHHHRVHAHQLEQHHVFGEVLLQRRVGHGVAAVLDDDGLAVELADVGQRLRQDLGLVAGADVGQVVVGRCRGRLRAHGRGLSVKWCNAANCRVRRRTGPRFFAIRSGCRASSAPSRSPPATASAWAPSRPWPPRCPGTCGRSCS